MDMQTPYTDMTINDIKRKIKSISNRKKVIHQGICTCGRRLVNLYPSPIDGKWRCKKCIDKEKNDNEKL